jgi:hypothetical protein
MLRERDLAEKHEQERESERAKSAIKALVFALLAEERHLAALFRIP